MAPQLGLQKSEKPVIFRKAKIMRRLLKELATAGSIQGDTTTLEDLSVIAKLKQDEE